MSPHALTVLVTDTSYKHSVGIIRSLGRQGHRIIAVSHSRLAPGRFSRFTARFAVVPNPATDADGFVCRIRQICEDNRVDLVIPVGFASCDALSHHLDRLGTTIRFAVPPPDVFDRASDKWKMCQHARELGLLVPDSMMASDTGSLRYFSEKHPIAILKSRRESWGKGARRLCASSDTAGFETQLKGIVGDHSVERFLLQEYVSGHGVGYMALCIEGRIVREFTHRRLREWPPDGGFATSAISTVDPELRQQGRRILESLNWHGPAMVEFRRGEQGAHFIEFNPKFWGSLEVALASGADFPGDLCAWASGHDLIAREYPDYSVGQRFWWPWRGDLRRLFRRPRDLGHILRDIASPSVQSNMSVRDPLPNMIEIAAELLYPVRRHE